MKRSSPEIEVYLDQLRALPFIRDAGLGKASRGDEEGVDAWIRVKTETGTYSLPVQLKKSHLLRETATSVVLQVKNRPYLLLFAPVVGREIAQMFQDAGVCFLDRAGNCYLNLDNRYVARVQGQTAVPRKASNKGLRAASYRVIFALLAEPGLVESPTRTIAEAAGGVSHQTVSNVRHWLIERELLTHSRNRYRWSPGKSGELMDIWLNGFVTTLWPSLLLGRFRSREKEPEALEASLEAVLGESPSWRWGGGAAAMRLTDYYRGEKTLVYFQGGGVSELRKRLPLVPDDRGNVLLAEAPGPTAFKGPREDTVHPLLVYTDLLVDGNDRAAEAADVLRQKYPIGLEGDR